MVDRRFPQVDELAASGILVDGEGRRFADEESTGLRAAFRERFCVFDRGDAAEQVIRKVMLSESAPA